MSVHIASKKIPAQLLKQGSFEDIDLSLLKIDEMPGTSLPSMKLCSAPPWPGDEVLIVDAEKATRSHIVAPQILPVTFRAKFTTLIADVATTGNSGSGVFNPIQKCLLGIMSRKFTIHTPAGDRDIAKYFVAAPLIRTFIPDDLIPVGELVQ
jgi:hypothetical protein